MPKRVLHILAICLFAVTMLGASNPDQRFDKLGFVGGLLLVILVLAAPRGVLGLVKTIRSRRGTTVLPAE